MIYAASLSTSNLVRALKVLQAGLRADAQGAPSMRQRLRLLVSVFCAAVIAGCQAPPSPAVRAFGDNKFWITVEDMQYVIGSTSERIVVPKGFVTDFASIPQGLWSLGLSPHGQYSRAAVVHDYLYWSQGCTRAQADRLLVLAMKESKVGSFDEFLVYQGVNLGGGGPWNTNANERKAGFPRVVPERYLRPADPNVDWPAYRDMLVKQGVRDPPFEQNPSYCVYGNSTTVP
jgi:hypothetical protein